MSIFKKIFGINKDSSSENSRITLVKEIHIKKIEKYTEGGKHAYFHFPGYERDIFCLEIIEDEFTKKKIFKANTIHSYGMDKVLLFSKHHSVFQLGLLSEVDKHYLTFAAYQKEMKINVNDTLSILLEDESIWELNVTKKGSRVEKDSEGVLFEGKEEIGLDKLLKLTTISMKKWRYFDSKNEKEFTNYFDAEKKRNMMELAQMFEIALRDL